MTKKDYALIAAALQAAFPAERIGPKAAQWAQDVRAIANALAADNDRFDRERFCTAAGLY